MLGLSGMRPLPSGLASDLLICQTVVSLYESLNFGMEGEHVVDA